MSALASMISYTQSRIHAVRLWKLLRSPFVLPEMCTAIHHQCVWEKIDIDVLGCSLCSSIHICSDQTCKDLIDMEDGSVCALSGCMVRTRRISENEYLDNVMPVDNQTSKRLFDEEVFGELMNSAFCNILTSQQAFKAHVLEVAKISDKHVQVMNFKKLSQLSEFICSES